jgi:type IV pilus assembly protein PilX
MMTVSMYGLSRQRGASLVISLIILGVLALIGVSAVMVANTQFRMSANLQLQTQALSGTENALAAAETWLLDNFASPAFATAGTINGIFPTPQADDPRTLTWSDSNSRPVDAAGNQRYRIELYIANRPLPSNSITTQAAYGAAAPTPFVNVYRITARGSSQGAIRIVQTHFAKKLGN